MYELKNIVIIPIILSFLFLIALIILLLKNKRKGTLLFLIAFAILAVGQVLAFISAGNAVFVCVPQCLCLLLMVPAWIISEHTVQKTIEEAESLEVPETIEDELLAAIDPTAADEEEKDEEILSLGRDFMVKASEAFAETDGLLQLLESINLSVIKTTNADGGAILLIDEFDDIIAVKTFSGSFPPPYKLPQDLPHKIARIETNFRFAQFPLGETIFGISATSGKPELITDPLNDERIAKNEPEDFLKAGSYIIIPMIVKDSVIGVLALARKAESPKFTEKEFSQAQILTNFASSAVFSVFSYQEIVEHSELTRESSIACKLQKSIHAKLTYSIPGATFGCFFNGAEGVCGDYYDIIPCRKDRISFILADVAGKGMNSLIVMVMLRAILQLVVNTQKSAGTILSWANRGITGKINIDHFASLVLVNYNAVEKTIQFATAGNRPLLLYHSDTQKIENLYIPSDPIGVDRSTEYKDVEIPVNSGDIVILYTDGLVEAIDSNSRQYGVEYVKKLVTENAGLKAQDISAKIKKNLKEFCGVAHQHDDQTLLVIKIQ